MRPCWSSTIRYWATPWLGLTPDFQYVFNPGGASSDDAAAVFGGQIMVNF